jgi:hypothetical protein
VKIKLDGNYLNVSIEFSLLIGCSGELEFVCSELWVSGLITNTLSLKIIYWLVFLIEKQCISFSVK